jgi:putative transcription factor
MQECEICGKRAEVVYEIDFEGVRTLACEKCARGRQVIGVLGQKKQPTPQGGRQAAQQEQEAMSEELAENYGELIRSARERMSLPLKVLAERISEKESTLAKVEKQETLPSEKTRKKLERELGIRLIVKVPASARQPQREPDRITLGDMIKPEKGGDE